MAPHARQTPEPAPSALDSHARACAAGVDDHLRRFLDTLALPPALDEPIRYALFGGGKRVRPLLAWLSCGALGADPRLTVPAGASVELVHAFSLVHDDLPAIDNDDRRRGRPSLHVHAGEAGAILAGDAMLSLSAHLLTRDVDDRELAAALVAELSRATTAMIVGQVLDLEPVDPRSPGAPQRLARIHESKTGALIAGACRMGALCAGHAGPGVDDDAIERVGRFGTAAGLMFQIVDDLIDVEQPTEWIGKSAGADDAAGKLTYPRVHGVEASRREVDRLRRACLGALDGLGRDADPLRQLVDYLASRTR